MPEAVVDSATITTPHVGCRASIRKSSFYQQLNCIESASSGERLFQRPFANLIAAGGVCGACCRCLYKRSSGHPCASFNRTIGQARDVPMQVMVARASCKLGRSALRRRQPARFRADRLFWLDWSPLGDLARFVTNSARPAAGHNESHNLVPPWHQYGDGHLENQRRSSRAAAILVCP